MHADTLPTDDPPRTSTKKQPSPGPWGWLLARRLWIQVTQHSLALLGLCLALAVATLWLNPALRLRTEQQLLDWLLTRHDVVNDMPATPAPEFVADSEPSAAERVVAGTLSELPKTQANVALWLSKRYRVAPEPLSVLVAEAFELGTQLKLDPTLILAVMAIESRFNPYAQSPVGAQGLMQVLTRVHTDKYQDFGGALAALDPVSNLRVGVKVLHDAIRRAGSTEGGLRLYVGAVSTDGSDYVNKVKAEQLRLQSVALGKPLPTTFPVYTAPAPSAAHGGAPGAPTVPRNAPIKLEPEPAAVEAEASQLPVLPARAS